MKWTDDLLLEHLTKESMERGQLQLAMYAVHLSTGNAIYCKQIKVKTIEAYVYNVATFLAAFSGIDHRKDNPGDKHMGKHLSQVYTDLHAYETMPRRREPYTLQMQALAQSEAAPRRLKDRAALIPVLANAFGFGLNAGLRRSEWAQPSGRADPRNPLRNHLKVGITTKAFVPDNLTAVTKSYRRLTGLSILLVPLQDIDEISVTWDTQKNGEHGESRKFVNDGDPSSPHNPVSCLYGLLQSWKACQERDPSLSPSFTPLSVYWDPVHSQVRLVTSDEIDSFIRALAARVLHLDPIKHKKELMLWSGHSIRVGACVLLHAMGFPPQDIKWLLRWKSDAFMAYLRNIALLSSRQNRALDRAAAMPRYV